MMPTDAASKPTPPGESTVAARDDQGASLPAPAHRVGVALISESRSPTREIQTLLRSRLLIVAALFFMAGTLGMLMRLGNEPPVGGVVFLAWLAPFNLVSLAISIWLWRAGPALSLRALRGAELALFGVLGLSMVAITLTVSRDAMAWCAQLGAEGMSLGARFAAMPWFAVLVTYGVCIPNTWRRCAAVVGALALMPLAIHAVVGLTDSRLDPSLLLVLLAEMALWMVMGVAIAVFGSHHIAGLRREAFEARKLGQYLLKERLGAGGMGEVYRAEHSLLRRPCAVKLIHPDRAGDPRHLLRFEREVQTTATLTHPNTIQIFDYGHGEDGTFYYVMEYLPGMTLDDLVRRHGPLPPARAIHFLRQVCAALREAHALGLVHRDVKPNNVMICERGGVHDFAKLLDFGLVLPATNLNNDRLTQQGAVNGTPAYLSPEQATGKDTLDARCDVYSLGAVAYFLLTSRPPFDDSSPLKVLAAHVYETAAPLASHRPDLPTDLAAIVHRCLNKSPADRFPDTETLDAALANCCKSETWTQEDAAKWWRERNQAEQFSFVSG